MNNLTKWFPPDIKPVHVGVYNVNNVNPKDPAAMCHLYAYWDGKRWGISEFSPEDAYFYKDDHFVNSQANQNKYWRGLVDPLQALADADKSLSLTI